MVAGEVSLWWNWLLLGAGNLVSGLEDDRFGQLVLVG